MISSRRKQTDQERMLVGQYTADVAQYDADVKYAQAQLDYATIGHRSTAASASATSIPEISSARATYTTMVTVVQLRPISVLITL